MGEAALAVLAVLAVLAAEASGSWSCVMGALIPLPLAGSSEPDELAIDRAASAIALADAGMIAGALTADDPGTADLAGGADVWGAGCVTGMTTAASAASGSVAAESAALLDAASGEAAADAAPSGDFSGALPGIAAGLAGIGLPPDGGVLPSGDWSSFTAALLRGGLPPASFRAPANDTPCAGTSDAALARALPVEDGT